MGQGGARSEGGERKEGRKSTQREYETNGGEGVEGNEEMKWGGAR